MELLLRYTPPVLVQRGLMGCGAGLVGPGDNRGALIRRRLLIRLERGKVGGNAGHPFAILGTDAHPGSMTPTF